METLFLICECHSLEHQVFFWKDTDTGEIYIQIHLENSNFFRRFAYAIKYLFGYKSRFGAWDEFLFKPEDLQKLKEFLNEETDNTNK